jgi:hypothetical protein
MSLSTKSRTLLAENTPYVQNFGTGPIEYRPHAHIETTTSERGPNYLRRIQAGTMGFSPEVTEKLLRFDWGHYFYSKKSWLKRDSYRDVSLSSGPPQAPTLRYNGGLMAVNPSSKIHVMGNAEMTLQQLQAMLLGMGATAISRTIPGKSAVDLATSLGELRQDGLPKAIEFRTMFENLKDSPKKVADGYLNLEFAWKPLISDLLGILQVAAKSERILEQYKRDSDRPIGRRYEFPEETSAWTTKEANQRPYPALASTWWTTVSAYRGYGELTSSYKRTSRTWFSGQYRYHIPDYPGVRGDIAEWQRQARVLLGLDASPKLFWELTRYSWLADWFANFGDILTNVSAIGKDNLVLQYGYIMRETTIEGEFAWNSYTPPVDRLPLQYITTSGVYNEKIRMKATPYGFGLNPSVFTARQWAILAALGISRAPNVL